MASARPASARLPAPSASGIDHVVVLMMENRSFDHYLGWLPGSDGRQAGLQYPDPAGQLHATYHLATYQGCGYTTSRRPPPLMPTPPTACADSGSLPW
jgi:phospholipase C